jgi:hypothetical protein
MPPKLKDEPVIETVNTWSRFEIARLHSLVQLLDGDVQLQVLPLFLRKSIYCSSSNRNVFKLIILAENYDNCAGSGSGKYCSR